MATKSLAHGTGTFYEDCEHPQTCWSKCSHQDTIRCRSCRPATPTGAEAAVARSVRGSTEAERSETALSSAGRGASRRPRPGPVSKPSAERVSWPSATRHGPPTSSSTASTAPTAKELTAISEQLAGKTLPDYAVPFVSLPPPERAHPRHTPWGVTPALNPVDSDGLGERIQRALPTTNVVKACVTQEQDTAVDPRGIGGDHTMFIAGEDADAKQQVTELLRASGWQDVLDLGPIVSSRGMEMYAHMHSAIQFALADPASASKSSADQPIPPRGPPRPPGPLHPGGQATSRPRRTTAVAATTPPVRRHHLPPASLAPAGPPARGGANCRGHPCRVSSRASLDWWSTRQVGRGCSSRKV